MLWKTVKAVWINRATLQINVQFGKKKTRQIYTQNNMQINTHLDKHAHIYLQNDIADKQDAYAFSPKRL